MTTSYLQLEQELIYREIALSHALRMAQDYEHDRHILTRANAFYEFIANGTVPTDTKKD